MTEPQIDFYRLIHVDASAHADAIHAAYRAMARKLHPDAAGDQAKMIQLNAAWETLRDPERRAAYDRALASGRGDAAGSPPGNGFGTVLSYGRYTGWSLGEVARSDPEFLRWLASVPQGRGLRREIEAVFAELDSRPVTLNGRRPAFRLG